MASRQKTERLERELAEERASHQELIDACSAMLDAIDACNNASRFIDRIQLLVSARRTVS